MPLANFGGWAIVGNAVLITLHRLLDGVFGMARNGKQTGAYAGYHIEVYSAHSSTSARMVSMSA